MGHPHRHGLGLYLRGLGIQWAFDDASERLLPERVRIAWRMLGKCFIDESSFLIQICCLTIAPGFFSAAIYCCLTKMYVA